MAWKFQHALVLSLLLALLLPLAASAHGNTQVGDDELVIGFHNEPAYLGEPNALDLFVTNTTTDEPVNGLDDILQVEIIYGASKQDLPLRAEFGQEGAYTADILLTKIGGYTWHIWGNLDAPDGDRDGYGNSTNRSRLPRRTPLYSSRQLLPNDRSLEAGSHHPACRTQRRTANL